ncbi:MAG: VWA domain-containing protein, partial [Elusimicrobia bacterium]|nr:VWA domain-containing protein [Elusimicrobiota bacterium]
AAPILPARAQTAAPQTAAPTTQTRAPPAPGVAAAAQAQTPAQADQQAPLPRPLTAAVSADRSDATVGDTIHLSLTLTNPTDKAITVQGLRTALNDALPQSLEVQGSGPEAALVLAPGRSKTVVYAVVPWAAGAIPLKGVLIDAAVAQTDAYPQGIEIALPDDAVVSVRSVLTPDWKQKGFRDIGGVVSAPTPNWVWAAGGVLALLLLIGAERLLAARRWYPKLDERRLSLVASTEGEIARLEDGADRMSAADFNAALQETVTRFMVDFAGLPMRVRGAKALARDLKSAKAFTPAQAALAAEIAARAEAARVAGVDGGESGRRRELARLRALVESVGRKAAAPQAAGKPGLDAFAAASGLQFGSPWALLLFVPFAAYLWKAVQARRATRGFALSTTAQLPARRGWRERLSWLPRGARLGAIAMLILALARPMIGVERLTSYTPSTDTMIVEDRSGSMDEAMGDVSKLQAAASAITAFVDAQRQGTENRVGMVTFDDTPYVDMRLTTDYDALISHLKDITSGGATAIGDAMLAGIGQFAEANMLDMDGSSDPRIATMLHILRAKGLGAALEYAKPYPDLMQEVLRPDRAKVLILFTDGESNSGIDPMQAAQIAAQLGVKVYTVGVGDEFDATTLQAIAQKTHAQFYKAGDAERMREVLLQISRLEKSPVKVVSSVSVNDYTAFLAMIAFLLLGAEAGLGSTKLRTLQAMILALSLQGAPLGLAPTAPAFSAAQPVGISAPAKLSAAPPEMKEGNRLYAEGRYDEALKQYALGVARHPDVAELYLDMGDAYLKLGDATRAQECYAKYLSLAKDPVKQSQALFNMGDAALAQKDGRKAFDDFKQALRRDPNNQDAKWNIEVLEQSQKNQQGQGQPKKGQHGQKGQQKGNQKGNQQGNQKGKQQGNQSGNQKGSQNGNQKGNPSGQADSGKKGQQKAAGQLADQLGQQQKAQDEAARQALVRKGDGVWGLLGLPLAGGLLGHGVIFSAPWLALAAPAAVVLAGLLSWYALRRRLKDARALAPGTAAASARSWWGFRRWLRKSALVLGAIGLIGLAAGGPRGGLVDQRVNFGGKDIVFAVDDSYSMLYAQDGRLAKTQKELTGFIEHLQGTDRVGLVVFAGQARTASPVSIDYGNFEFKINRLEYESRGLTPGSDLAGAVEYAAHTFDNAKKIGDRQRVLIVISDGDVFDQDVANAIASARKNGITIYAIGVGSPAGTKIALPNENGDGTSYLIDEKTGQPAVSRLVETQLRKLAEGTGGAYFRAGDGATIEKVMESVAQLEKGRKSDTIKSPQPIGVYLLWPALALLLADLLIPGASFLRRDERERRRKDEGAPGSGPGLGGGKAGMMAAGLVPLAAWPQILPFALLGTAVAGFVAWDVWTGGRVQRLVRDAWGRRTGAVEKGVAADLTRLYDLREADVPRLRAFVARWSAADAKSRAELAREAASDEALWREKLTAAFLSGAEPETQELVLRTLRRRAASGVEPLAPTTGLLAERIARLPWGEHADAR